MPVEAKKLYYFTRSFPYGFGETWKSNELKFLRRHFEQIEVVPYSYDRNFDSPKELPSGVNAVKPLFQTDEVDLTFRSTLSLLNRHFLYFLSEALRNKVFLSRKKTVTWLYASLRIVNLMRHPYIVNLLQRGNPDSVLYFFWGKGSCDFLPFLPKRRFARTLVRFHRHDLFLDQNAGYIPYRKQLIGATDIVAPSSANGLRHLTESFPQARHLRIVPLGVVDAGRVKESTDKTMRIVSCSFVVPVKRVDIIARAMSTLSVPVEWTHIGDGSLMEELRALTTGLPAHIKVIFPGIIEANGLMAYYHSRAIDLFVNVSSSEGVPVSIMEALSLGIPVFATDVGGTSDVIDNNVGALLPADLNPLLLAEKLTSFYWLSPESKRLLRESARRRFESMCNAEQLTDNLAQLLLANNEGHQGNSKI